ncbi:MAG: hypothetical protein JSS81_24050, partial [Acidobacteria bacterium]|nr:hypothetical protein [Acidobacteriota bacterium]
MLFLIIPVSTRREKTARRVGRVLSSAFRRPPFSPEIYSHEACSRLKAELETYSERKTRQNAKSRARRALRPAKSAQKMNFLAKKVFFCAQKVNFLDKKISFLAKKFSFLAKKESFLAKENSFLAKKVFFCAQKVITERYMN